MIKRAFFLTIVYFSSAALGVSSRASSFQRTDVAKCAQDVVDYKYDAQEGVRFAARLLRQMDSAFGDLSALQSACVSYLAQKHRTDISRNDQLLALSELKISLGKNIYFFLRSAIRPLIACTSQGDSILRRIRKCISATGRVWYEVSLRGFDSKDVDFRLGHSERAYGLIVRGPQDFLNDEDRDYINSLPKWFARSALETMGGVLNREFLDFKIAPCASIQTFINFYFQK